MRNIVGLLFSILLIQIAANAQDTSLSFRKIDTTVKIGKAGYRVDCRNNRPTENQLSVRPIGFDNTVQPINFPIRGRVFDAQVDDLNSDGLPGFSANDWLAPIMTYFFLSAYADLRSPSDPRRYGQIRTMAVVISLVANVVTI